MWATASVWASTTNQTTREKKRQETRNSNGLCFLMPQLIQNMARGYTFPPTSCLKHFCCNVNYALLFFSQKKSYLKAVSYLAPKHFGCFIQPKNILILKSALAQSRQVFDYKIAGKKSSFKPAEKTKKRFEASLLTNFAEELIKISHLTSPCCWVVREKKRGSFLLYTQQVLRR